MKWTLLICFIYRVRNPLTEIHPEAEKIRGVGERERKEKERILFYTLACLSSTCSSDIVSYRRGW